MISFLFLVSPNPLYKYISRYLWRERLLHIKRSREGEIHLHTNQVGIAQNVGMKGERGTICRCASHAHRCALGLFLDMQFSNFAFSPQLLVHKLPIVFALQVARWHEKIGKWGIPEKSIQNVAQLSWNYLRRTLQLKVMVENSFLGKHPLYFTLNAQIPECGEFFLPGWSPTDDPA